jgi:hypothetical protein
VKWAGLEPKETVVDSGSGGVKITINLGPDPKDARTIEAETEIEDAPAVEYSESVH